MRTTASNNRLSRESPFLINVFTYSVLKEAFKRSTFIAKFSTKKKERKKENVRIIISLLFWYNIVIIGIIVELKQKYICVARP